MTKKSYKYILFDWDGSLADSLWLWLKAYQDVFPLYNVTLSEQEIIDKIFHTWDHLRDVGITDINTFGEQVYKIVNEQIHTVKLHEEVIDVLQKLKEKDKKVAIVTSSEKNTFLTNFNKHNCEHFFDALVTRNDVTRYKPHPEPIFKAMNLLDASPDETIMIGDSFADLMGGKNAGIDTVWCYLKPNERFYKQDHFDDVKPTYIIRKMGDLLNIIN